MAENSLDHSNASYHFPWEVYSNNFSSIKQHILENDFKFTKTEPKKQIDRLKTDFFSNVVPRLVISEQEAFRLNSLIIKIEKNVSQLFLTSKAIYIYVLRISLAHASGCKCLATRRLWNYIPKCYTLFPK